MKRFAFHIEIIIQGERKKLREDRIAAILKEWQQDLKTQVFENDGMEIKIAKIKEDALRKGDSTVDPWRQAADPLLVTHDLNKV